MNRRQEEAVVEIIDLCARVYWYAASLELEFSVAGGRPDLFPVTVTIHDTDGTTRQDGYDSLFLLKRAAKAACPRNCLACRADTVSRVLFS